jgi:CRISPR-associated protein Csm4
MYKKLILKSKSSFSTPLRSDVIFGHICWRMVEKYGQNKLVSFLNDMIEKPIFLVSDGFPDNYLPRSLDGDQHEDGTNKSEKISLMKRIKKEKKILLSKPKNNNCIDWQNAEIDVEKFIFLQDTIIHNVIDRDNNLVIEGGIFDEEIYKSNSCWNIYINVLDDNKYEDYEIDQLLINVFEIGYGRKKSIGKGSFEASWDGNFKFFAENNSMRKLLISHCVLSEKEKDVLLNNSMYRIETKYGKLGEIYANCTNPFKKPLIQLKPGSVLMTNKNYVGEMLMLVQNKELKDKVWDYNYGFLI